MKVLKCDDKQEIPETAVKFRSDSTCCKACEVSWQWASVKVLQILE